MFTVPLNSAGRSAPLLAPTLAVIGLIALPDFVPKAAAASIPEVGTWVNDSGEGAVEIYICGEKSNYLCGRIVWLKDPLNAEGVPKWDRYNPKPDLQKRPICGLPVLGNLGRMSDGSFDNGWIYDPKTGKTYSAAIQAAGNKLDVRGYVGIKMAGKSFVWTRAPGDLGRCEGAPGTQTQKKQTPPATAAAKAPAVPAKAPAATAPPSTKAATTAPAATSPPPAKTATAPPPQAPAKAPTAAAVPVPQGGRADPPIKAPAPVAAKPPQKTPPRVATSPDSDPLPPLGWSGDYGR